MIADDLQTHGLSEEIARKRLAEHGPNALPEHPPEPTWRRLVRQFQSPLIYILMVALGIDLVLWVREGLTGVPWESLAIGLILTLNAGLGVYQEGKAEKALARLRQLATPRVWVRRDGQWTQLASTALVPGDLVRLEAGDRIPADGRTLVSESFTVDESMLTGESVPVSKRADEELASGTLGVAGKAFFEVTRTGPASALGRLASLIAGVKAEPTPLERRLKVFGDQVARWILGLAAVLVVAGLLIEGPAQLGRVLLFAVALAVAAIPEGLPAVLTLTLALGVERMAARRAVVRRLAAVEALGSVTVIATDKTGTLTENRMQVHALDAPDPTRARVALVHANDAETAAGDPLDVALLEYVAAQGEDPGALRQGAPRLSSRPFDSGAKFMRATVREQGRAVSYLKGASEVLIERCRLAVNERERWHKQALAYAGEGYRVLGIAWGEGEREDDLDFLGLVLFWDPPRSEVPDAVAQARAAGIRVLMITGDHPATALAIAGKIGIAGQRVLTGAELDRCDGEGFRAALAEVNVFARVSPEHKLRLVGALKESGEVVAMTGDGVNDAPALKRSDVGVAMGQRGSDVSREVADLVLLDDNFATIVAAIEEGRSIYENIQKFLRFLFAANLALVLLVVGGMAGSLALDLRTAAGALVVPLTAVQLLWINFVTNGPPALALGLDANPGMMRRPPRPARSPLLDRTSLVFIVLGGLLVGMIALAILAVLPMVGFSVPEASTAVFVYIACAGLVLAYPARSLSDRPRANPWVHLAVALGVVLQLVAVLVEWLRTPLELSPLGPALLGWTGAAVVITWALAELLVRLGTNHHPEAD